jgi:hypothetical protein
MVQEVGWQRYERVGKKDLCLVAVLVVVVAVIVVVVVVVNQLMACKK